MVVTAVLEATPAPQSPKSFITVLPVMVLAISVTKVTTVATATPTTVSLITVCLMVHLSLTVVSATLDTQSYHMVTTTMVEYKFFLTALPAMVASVTVATEVTEVTATADTKLYPTVKPSELMAIRSPSRSIFMYTTIINITEEQNVREFKMKN